MSPASRFCLALVILAVSVTLAQADEPFSVASRLKDSHPIVTAHRGCFEFGPENSLKAISACADIGVDAIEVDVRSTQDGVLVLLHDETLDRMTNATGPLHGYTYQELQQFRLRDGPGGKNSPLTDERIPTLREALRMAKKHGVLVFLDVTKEPNFNESFDVVVAENAEEGVIFALDAAAGSAKLRSARFLGKAAYLPVVWQCDQKDRQVDCYETLSEVIADYEQYNPVAYDYDPFIDSATPVDKRGRPVLASTGNDEAAWAQAVDMGIEFMFTDHPVKLMDYLKSKGLSGRRDQSEQR